MAEAQVIPAISVEESSERNRLAFAVIAGHAIKHLYLSSLSAVILPDIKINMGLSETQFGTMASSQQFAGWTTTVGAGYLGDRYSSKTAIMLAISLGLMGIAYFLVGISVGYAMILGALFLAGIGPSIYHPPALGALSRRFPDKRAFAVSLHGMGGSVGEVLGPLVASGLLVFLSWQNILQLSLLPALLAAFFMWRLIGNIRFENGVSGSFLQYLRTVVSVLRNKAVATIFLVTVIRSMAQIAVVAFLPLYLREDFGFSVGAASLFVVLANVAGIGSQPLMGFLSDRFGFKKVLTPALFSMALLMIAIALAQDTVQLAIAVILLGAFLYSLHSIFIAAAMSVSEEGTQATIVSLIYGASFVATLSPFLAGALADKFGKPSIFLAAAILVMGASFIFAFMRLAKPDSGSAA